jgi:hypothetical protein
MDAARAKRAAAKQVGADRKAQTQLQRAVTKAPGSSAGAETADEAPARLRRAEAILRARTGRFALVLERVSDSFNQSAVLRSAEAFGVQHIFVVEPTVLRNESTKPLSFARQITKNCHRYPGESRPFCSRLALARVRLHLPNPWPYFPGLQVVDGVFL